MIALKYDSWDDFMYFVVGASLAAGRVFWVGSEGGTNKALKNESNENVEVYVSRDKKVGTLKVRR